MPARYTRTYTDIRMTYIIYRDSRTAFLQIFRPVNGKWIPQSCRDVSHEFITGAFEPEALRARGFRKERN